MEAADGLSLCLIHVGSHLLQPRLLMRRMKGIPLPLLQFPAYEKLFFFKYFSLLSETAPTPLLDCRRPSLLLWQIGA